MKAWSHLPNAHHIDWVIESVKENPQLWGEAWPAIWPAVYLLTVGRQARRAAGAARHGAVLAAWDAADSAGATGAALLALVAYDDCDQYINMGYEKLQVYATLSEKPQAMLLLPMVYVREKLNE